MTSVEDDLLDPEAAPPGMRVIGYGALVASLSPLRTGAGMRDIVATIQREQDDAIRSPAFGGVTIVRGGPGTGKTAVALHRAAFLLYSDRQRFAPAVACWWSGRHRSSSPISPACCPRLGEDEVTLASLGEVVDGVRAIRRDDPAVAEVKGSGRMAEVLRRTARQAVPGAPTEFRYFYRDDVLHLGPRELSAIRRQLLAADPPQPLHHQGGLGADRRAVAPGPRRAGA